MSTMEAQVESSGGVAQAQDDAVKGDRHLIQERHELEKKGNRALRNALRNPWMNGDLPLDIHRDLLRITSKGNAGFMAPLLYAMNTGRATREQIATVLILMRALSGYRGTLGVTRRGDVVTREILLNALLAPGVGNSTLVRGVVEACRGVLALSPSEFPGGEDSHVAALDPVVFRGLSSVMHSVPTSIADYDGDSSELLSSIYAKIHQSPGSVLTQERLRSALEGDVFEELRGLGQTLAGAQAVSGYLAFLGNVYGTGGGSGYLSPPAFIANRSRGFFEREYPCIYGEFISMDPALAPGVMRGVSLLRGRGDDEFLFSLLPHLPRLSGARVGEFGALVEEFNWDWAVAAFEWGA